MGNFSSPWLHVFAGFYGPVTFAMCVIGAEMMMEVMVSSLQFYLFIELYAYFSSFRNFPFFLVLVIVQLYYFVLGSMRIVAHNQDMCGLMLRVSSMLIP